MRAQTELLKTEGLEALDRFSGGELSRLQGRPLYPPLLEATAIRYTLHRTEREGNLASAAAPSECPHGYRMTMCNTCRKEAS